MYLSTAISRNTLNEENHMDYEFGFVETRMDAWTYLNYWTVLERTGRLLIQLQWT